MHVQHTPNDNRMVTIKQQGVTFKTQDDDREDLWGMQYTMYIQDCVKQKRLPVALQKLILP